MTHLEQYEKELLGERYLEENLPKSDVIEILTKGSIYLELGSTILERISVDYDDKLLNEHSVKKLVLCEIYLSAIECLLLDEYIPKFKITQATYYIHTFSKSKIIAQAFPNYNFIHVGEGLHKFLWDFYTIPPNYQQKYKNNDVLDDNERAFIKKAQRDLCNSLRTMQYGQGYNLYEPIQLRLEGTTHKLNIFMATFFIYCHEFGHIFLRHSCKANWFNPFGKKNDDKPVILTRFTKQQIQELDADMFASDLYFSFLDNILNTVPFELKKDLCITGLDFLKEMGFIEQTWDWNYFHNSEHPPSGIRLMYIILRNKDRFIRFGHENLVKEVERGIDSGKIPIYSYNKDLNSQSILKFAF